MSRFQNFAADDARKKLRSAWFFQITLRVALINELIRIKVGLGGYFSYHVSKMILARIRRLSQSSVGLF